MNWAIERDEDGLPRRMVYMGHIKPQPKQERKIVPGCPGCGFHFGWHAKGCQKRAVQPGRERG
jgi:hypothetical protein